MNTDALVQAIVAAGDNLKEAVTRESLLEDARPMVKNRAIKRLMDAAGLSATAAEKVVAQDAEYSDHQAAQRAATRETIAARAYYEAAKVRAWLAVGVPA